MDSQWFDHLTDHAGALHVHTVKSDGAGTLGEVVAAAERAGLSFLIITDHDTRGYADEGAEGWHGSVLVVAGEEVSVGSTRFLVAGHVGKLAKRGHLKKGLQNARENGGITIALPPEDATAQLPGAEEVEAEAETLAEGEPASTDGKSEHAPEPPPQVDWPVEFVDGWEFWCGLEDWARGRQERKSMTSPFERVEHVGLRGPRRGAVRIWDDLSRRGRVLGFAGLNAHGRTWSSNAPGAALPYETLFRSLSTHVLSPELPPDAPDLARALLMRAIRNGHFHTVQSCIAPPENFRFVAEAPGREPLLEGDTASFHPKAVVRVRLPRSAEIRLIHNGHQLLAAEGRGLEFPAVRPGAYRVEAWLDRRPWIFSNPIWFTRPTEEEKKAYRQQAREETASEAGAVYEDLLDLAT